MTSAMARMTVCQEPHDHVVFAREAGAGHQARIECEDRDAPGAVRERRHDLRGHLYVADSFGTIARLPAGMTTLSTWSMHPDWVPAPNQFEVDGIVWDGGTNIYVNTLASGGLYRVPITPAGAAGAVAEIT